MISTMSKLRFRKIRQNWPWIGIEKTCMINTFAMHFMNRLSNLKKVE